MNLRELVNENSTYEDLRVLAEQPFEIDGEDFLVINKIGKRYRAIFFENYAREHPDRVRRIPFPLIDFPLKFDINAQRSEYDNSPECSIFSNYVAHILKGEGIDEKTVEAFNDFSQLLSSAYQQFPNATTEDFYERLDDPLSRMDIASVKNVIEKVRESFRKSKRNISRGERVLISPDEDYYLAHHFFGTIGYFLYRLK